MTMTENNINYLSLVQVATAIRSRDLSPVDIVTSTLDRIERLNPHINAYFHIFREEALGRAREMTTEISRGHYRGALHGVPVAVKDNIACGPTTAGSLLRRDHVAVQDAAVVERLTAAGAIVVGKSAAFEFAFGTPDRTSPYPPALNPWDVELMPGGSSSGSGVAVAAGLACGALGTDTGGSVRIPAFHCGVVGLQPTYGLVSRYGVIPLAWSKDHVGFLARTVADAALLLQGGAAYDSRDPGSADVAIPDYVAGIDAGLHGIKLGIPWPFFGSTCHPEILGSFRLAVEVMKELGARVGDANLDVTLRELSGNSYITTWSEAAAYHMADLRAQPQLFGRELRLYLMFGATLPAYVYLQAQRFRRKLRSTMMELFRRHDVLMLPTTGSFPDAVPDGPRPVATWMGSEPPTTYTALSNLAWLPSMSVPSGFSEAGLPIGYMLIAPPFHEATLLRVAHAYETATPWHLRHPMLDSGEAALSKMDRFREPP
jgi:aspartyl-tRNA(Asn)/glutamyl-tRNA(Gln) amidotransferase subunit A